MNRRELIKQISLLTGAAVVGSEFFLSGCKNNDSTPAGLYTAGDTAFFDEVAETILPRTDTPGAKDAEVGKFMVHYATDCYDEQAQTTLKEGIAKLNAAARAKYNNSFTAISAEEKQALLTGIDAEAKKYEQNKKNENDPSHYFTLMKQLVMLGFFTSRPGVTQVLRYLPVPGKYEGCTDYNGETSWA